MQNALQKISCKQKKHHSEIIERGRLYFQHKMPRWLSPQTRKFLQIKDAKQEECSSRTISQNKKSKRRQMRIEGVFSYKILNKWRMPFQEISCKQKKHL